MKANRLLCGVLIATVIVSAMGATYAAFEDYELEYCANGDGTHYVYSPIPGVDYERTEDCAYIEGVCPYCGYEFPLEEVDDLKGYSGNPDYESSYREYDGHDRAYIEEQGTGQESTDIFDVGGDAGEASLDGGVVTDWYVFSQQEVVILAQVMRHEAGNQPEAGKIGVVEVILNRMRSPYFTQNTVSGIVYAPHQFSYISRSKGIVPTEYELDLVRDVILGHKRVFNDANVLYFRNTVVTSGFANSCAVDWGSHRYATYIQDHSFYYQ